MKYRIENKKDFYETLLKWWDEHDFEPIAFSALPNTIFVAYNDKIDLCGIPVYQTDSDFCYLGFITVNKSARMRDKAKVIPFLVEQIQIGAKQRGYGRLLITCNVTGIMKNLEKSGFMLVDKTNYYLKNI